MSKSEVLAKFETLAAIPHCSYETDKMRDFLADFARDKGCEVVVDSFGNVHAFKGKPKICLQSHYDMVCMGDAPKIEIVYGDDGYMRAKNSSLGADNGIGVAIMMQMISEFDDIECLFTNNEEVGMVGAAGFSGDLKADKLLNLDSEEDDRVTIGCAGGVNLFATIALNSQKTKESTLYEVKVSGLPGGHSGNEIHKNIPNAIKVLATFVTKNGCRLVKFEGGERSNSIPSSATALVLSDKELKSECENLSVKKLGTGDEILENGEKILALINSFSQGVRVYNCELGIPQDSVNLSLAKIKDDGTLEVEFFARSMSKDGLNRMEFEISELAKAIGFNVISKDRNPAWKPINDKFANDILEELKIYKPNARITAVHAGLECGVLLEKKAGLSACSIGPNIYSPHSTREHCEVASALFIEKVVRGIVKKYNS